MTVSPRYDVIVAGLGAWGSAALYHCARRGHRVLGLDRFAPPHDRGSHHGNGRVIRMASPEAPSYTPMMQRSYELWRILAGEWGRPLVETTGAVYVAPPEAEIVAGAIASYRESDFPHEVLEAPAARRRFPWLAIADGEIAVVEPDAGVLQPEHCLRAHLRGAAAARAEIRVNEALADWRAEDGGVEVETSAGRYASDRLVLALGSWAPDFLKLAVPLAVERQVVAIYDAGALPAPAIFVAPAQEAECVYGLPEAGRTYKVALHHGGITGHPDTLDATVREADLALIARYVHQRLPDLPAQPLAAYTCRYTNAPDRQFVLGPHPRHDRVILAAGCSGRGYKFAAAIGEVLAQLCEGTPAFDLSACSPARFTAGSTTSTGREVQGAPVHGARA